MSLKFHRILGYVMFDFPIQQSFANFSPTNYVDTDDRIVFVSASGGHRGGFQLFFGTQVGKRK
jgi:hypothetical protein